MRTPYSPAPVRRVLISGAGIAGPALASTLVARGFEVVVVERAPAPRPGGQPVDIRGVALDVVDDLGLLADVRRHRTVMRGMSMVDGAGTELWTSTDMALSSGRLDGPDVEILRDDLTRLLRQVAADRVRYRFDETITGLLDGPDGVRVTFARGGAETFDLVVGADGLRSPVRRLAFGDDPTQLRLLGTYVGVFTTPNVLGLDRWQTWLQADGVGGMVGTARDNTELRATLGFASGPLTWDRRDPQAARRLLADRLAGVGAFVPALLPHLWSAPDFWFDAMAQVRLGRWSTGRIVLLGDAGYAPSPLSGQGTSLALVGAHVLATELARAGGDHRVALDGYERRLRPFVERNQALVDENPGGPAPQESVAAAARAIDLGSGPAR